jgi:replicative DNA helicase
MAEIKRPENTKAELALIKTCLLKPELVPDIMASVDGQMYWDASNKIVFNTIKRMHDKDAPIDEATLRGHLNSTYDQIGGDDFFDGLHRLESFPDNWEEYADGVKDTHVLRQVIDIGMDVASAAMHETKPSRVISKLTDYTDRLVGGLSADGIMFPIGDLAELQYQHFLDRLQDPGFTGVRTGIDDFDLVFGGLNKSDLVYVAGRPSMGKTSLLLTWFLNMSKQGIPVALFSYEMSPEQIFWRLVSMESGVSYTDLLSGRVIDLDIVTVEKAIAVVRSIPFHIAYATSFGIDGIINAASKYVRHANVEAFGLDYLQLMGEGSNNRNIELGNISKKLKVHAVKDNVLWIAASQLSRACESRTDRRPWLSDLRDSGSLEQDADMVAFIYRDHMYEPSPDNEHDAEILVAKNRNGPTANIMLHFEQQSMVFRNLEEI